MNITKVEFIEIIDALRGQVDYDVKIARKLSEIYGSDVPVTDNSRITNQIFKILHKQFPPEDGFCHIQHFCYELDFGRVAGSWDSVDVLWDFLNNDL